MIKSRSRDPAHPRPPTPDDRVTCARVPVICRVCPAPPLEARVFCRLFLRPALSAELVGAVAACIKLGYATFAQINTHSKACTTHRGLDINTTQKTIGHGLRWYKNKAAKSWVTLPWIQGSLRCAVCCTGDGCRQMMVSHGPEAGGQQGSIRRKGP